MEILIGRDSDTNCLALLVDGKRGKDSTTIFPNSVSRLKPEDNTAHCRISVKGNDIRITNLNSHNVTYVDGEEIKSSKKTKIPSLMTEDIFEIPL